MADSELLPAKPKPRNRLDVLRNLNNPSKKGLSYGELLVDNILGLDNEYESFGEKLGKAINEDEVSFLKDAAVGIYESAKEFVTSPVETTKEVIRGVKTSVSRLASDDLEDRLRNMYDVDYEEATDEQVNAAREAVFGDVLTAMELIPAAKVTVSAAKAGSAAIPSGVKADVVGQTKALLSGDTEFLRGTPTERSSTVGVGAQRADKPTLQFETSSGSTYDQFKNATTIRNRAERDDNEVSGVQPRSGKTVFMNKESIDTIGPLFQNTEIPVQFVPLEGNKAKLIYTEDYGPKKAGEDASNVVQFTTSPRMGLHPVEIMDSKNTDRRNIHFGNEIVKIRSASKKDKETKKEPKVSFAPLVRPNEKKTAVAKAMDINEAAAINQRSTSPEEIKKIKDMDITKLESSDFYSSILPGVASLDIPEGGIKGSKVKDFLEKDNNISNTQLYWSGLLNEIDSDTIYDKDTLVNLARQNIPKIQIITNTGRYNARYKDLQRIPLVEDSSTDKFVTKQSLPVPGHIRFEGQPGAEKDYYKELIAFNKNPKGNFYQAAESHWGHGGTAIAHTRLSHYTHNGNKFAVVEELQSDMAQVATDDRNKNLEVATKENSTKEIPLTAGDISDSLTDSSSDLVSSFYIGEAPADFKFTNRFEKELENISQAFYNKSFNDLASEQEFVEVSETVLSDLMFQFANLKFKYENNEIGMDEVIQKITTNMPGITEKVLLRKTYDNLVSTPIDKIFSNAFSDYVFGKSTVKNNPDLKNKIADLFDTAPSIADFKKTNLSMLKQSEATRVSLLMAIKDAKKNNINKIYVVPPKTAAYYHSFSEDTADKIYNSTLNKVLKTLNTETNNAVKYQRKNPEGIRFPISKPIGRAGSWEFDDDQIAMEIDITDFNLPDKPQFRLFKGGLVNKFAKGGVVEDMDNQMKMAFMEEGGLQDDGMDQDPVSGNEVPSGSMAKEVRDDVPAQLSEGEYVVPADVVRFYGVKFFEDLRMEAKKGLQDMEANGRIGGEPVDSPMARPDMPQEMSEDLSSEELEFLQSIAASSQDLDNLGQDMSTNVRQLNEGGSVRGYYTAGDVKTSVPSFLRDYATPGALQLKMSTEPSNDTDDTSEDKEPEDGCPEGMMWNGSMCVIDPNYAATTRSDRDDDDDDPVQTSAPWYEGEDLSDINSFLDKTLAEEEQPTSVIGGLLSNMPIMKAVGSIGKLSNVAKARAAVEIAKSSGGQYTESQIEDMEDRIDDYISDNKINPNLANTIASGALNTSAFMNAADKNKDGVITPEEMSEATGVATPTSTGVQTPTSTGVPKGTDSNNDGPSSYDTTTKEQIQQRQSDRSERSSQITAGQKIAGQDMSGKTDQYKTEAVKQATKGTTEEERKGGAELDASMGISGLNKGGLMKKKRKK